MDRRPRWARIALAVVVLSGIALPAPASAEPGLRKAVSMSSINHGGDLEDLTAHGNLTTVGRTGARDPGEARATTRGGAA